MNLTRERRLLQLSLAAGCVVAFAAGAAGIVSGGAFLRGVEAPVPADLDSHMRYLSGLLLAIGVGFAACISGIERKGRWILALAGIVLVGGLARLASLVVVGVPSEGHVFGLAMELGVVPLIALWQRSFARRWRRR